VFYSQSAQFWPRGSWPIEDFLWTEVRMLKWALFFLVISIIAGLFGFTGISAAAAGIAKVLFFIFIVIFVVLLVLALVVGREIF
jgi:uncharacterized membrane protein YtjA (UPF0391 family)